MDAEERMKSERREEGVSSEAEGRERWATASVRDGHGRSNEPQFAVEFE